MKTYKASFLVLLPLISVSLAGCGEKVIHEHTYSNDWSFNNTSHWHSATCEHSDLKSNEGDHIDNNHDNKCDVCGFDISIPPTPVTEDYKVNAQEWEAAFGKNKPFGIADNYKFSYIENTSNQSYEYKFEVDGNKAKITVSDGSYSSMSYFSYESNAYYAFYSNNGTWVKQESTNPKDTILSGLYEYYSNPSLFTFDEQNNVYKRSSFVVSGVTYKDVYIKFQDKKIRSYGLKGEFYSNGSKMTGSIDGTIEYGNQIVVLPPIPEHVHTYSTVWNADSTGHWHDATCGHDVIKDFAAHYDNNADGYCDVCSYVVGGMSNQVSETTWNSIMSGVGPFYLFDNASIMFAQKYNDNVVESFNINLAGNLARDDSANYTNSKFYQHDNNEDLYYKLEYDPTNGYERKSASWNGSDMGNVYFVSKILSSLNYSDFSFDSTKGKYCANHKINVYGQDFDEFEIMFAYNSLVSAVGTVYYSTTDNIYFTLDVMYGGVNIVLPPYKDIEKIDLELWTTFGAAYSQIFNSIVAPLNNNLSHDKFEVNLTTTSQGSYLNAKKSMMSAIMTGDYPDMIMGYQDDFADYAMSDILQPFDDYIGDYNNYFRCDLLNDYYPQYIANSNQLIFDEYGNGKMTSLPFSRAVNVMAYNTAFVSYCASLSEYSSYKLDEIPETWQEWEIKGPIYKQIFDSLVSNHYAVYADVDSYGFASNFSVHHRDNYQDANGDYIENGTNKPLVLDFTYGDVNLTRLLTYENTDEMFSTLVREWGAEFTNVSNSEKLTEIAFRRGDVLFASRENEPKVVECLKYFKNLNNKRVIGVPQEMQSSYASEAFNSYQTMFIVTTSPNLLYLSRDVKTRVGIAPVPYYDDGVNVRKYSMQMGGNIAITDRVFYETTSKSVRHENALDCLATISQLNTGDNGAEWCINTGYVPVTKSATNSQKYQEFFNASGEITDSSSKILNSNRDAAHVSIDVYNKLEENWILYENPAFLSSSRVLEAVRNIFLYVFVGLESSAEDNEYVQIIENAVSDLKTLPNIRIAE